MTKKNHESDVAFIQALAELLAENDLTELQVKRVYGEGDSINVHVSRAEPPATTMIAATAPAPTPGAAPPAAAAVSATPAEDLGALPAW